MNSWDINKKDLVLCTLTYMVTVCWEGRLLPRTGLPCFARTVSLQYSRGVAKPISSPVRSSRCARSSMLQRIREVIWSCPILWFINSQECLEANFVIYRKPRCKYWTNVLTSVRFCKHPGSCVFEQTKAVWWSPARCMNRLLASGGGKCIFALFVFNYCAWTDSLALSRRWEKKPFDLVVYLFSVFGSE